jgi:hypothetical protein
MSGGWRLVFGLSMLCAFALIWCFTRTLFSIVYRSGTSAVVKDFVRFQPVPSRTYRRHCQWYSIIVFVTWVSTWVTWRTWWVKALIALCLKNVPALNRDYSPTVSKCHLCPLCSMLWTWLSPNLVKCKQFVIFKGSLAKLRISSTVQRNELRFWRMQ